MNILFELNHPKHYLQYKQIADKAKNICHSFFLAKEKDMLIQLLENDNRAYYMIDSQANSLIKKIVNIPKYISHYSKIVDAIRPDVIVSKASPYAAVVGIRKKIPTIATPDSEVVLLTNKFVAPLTSVIITQNTFRINYGRKHNKVNGFFEDQYLQPGYFIPDKKALIGHGINPHEKYAVIRFVGWTANHDLFKKGITMKQKEEFVNALNKHCKVYVSSEKALSPRLSKFLLPTPPNLVHQVLHFASLYVGDSQTMATEAALLGTPSVRVNSFVGQNDMSNFMELENNYKMLYNFPDISAATNKAIELIESSAVKDEWLQKRAAYYCNRGDINDEILEIILDTVKQKINRVSVDGK